MPTLRFLVRFTFLVCWTTLFVMVYALAWPVTKRPELRRRRLRRWLLQRWAAGLMWAWNIHMDIQGAPPRPPYFLVANHLSYIDILAITRFAGPIFVARGDVESWPVIGTIIRSTHMIFINRADRRDTYRVNKLIEHALATGDGVAVFAESRISRGIGVEPFKSALIQPAAAMGIPVHHVTVTYRSLPGAAPAHEAVSWWLPVPFFAHLRRLLACRGYVCVLHWGEEPIQSTDRKTLARELHAAVQANFVPVA